MTLSAPAPEVAAPLDVLIVGGGPVGACLAALLLRCAGYPAQRVGLLERQRPRMPPSADTPDLRVSAFSRSSERILAAAGAWDAIAAGRVSPYERMRVWHASEPFGPTAGLGFDAAEIGEANLGYIIENRAVQGALLAAFERQGGRVIESAIVDLQFDRDHVVVATDGAPLRARLVVGADGGQSRVRELAGLAAEARSYEQSAIVGVVRTERPPEHTAWQRFLGTGTLAFLPLADGDCSFVWSVATDEAERLSALDATAFGDAIGVALDHALGRVRLVSERAAIPLRQIAASRYAIERCVLVGDAAHVVHPLAGQGVNLGLLDAAALCDALRGARAEGEDPGALRILRRYERWRRSENELANVALNAFNRFLATGSGPLSRAAQRGLALIDRSAWVKRALMGRALGISGELPTAAMPARAGAGLHAGMQP